MLLIRLLLAFMVAVTWVIVTLPPDPTIRYLVLSFALFFVGMIVVSLLAEIIAVKFFRGRRS